MAVTWIVATAAVASAAALDVRLAAGAVAAAAAVAVWRWPEHAAAVSAAAVLALRPALDVFSTRVYGQTALAVSPAVVFGVAVLLVAAILAARRGRAGLPLWPDRAFLRAHVGLFAAYAVAWASGTLLFGGVGLSNGLREAVRVSSILAGFMIVAWWATERLERVAYGWTLLVAGAVPPVLVALWQWVTGQGYLETEGLNRLQGTFSHPNSFGSYLVLFILVALAGTPRARGAGRWWRIAVAIGLAVLVARTYSRTGLLVLLTGLAVLPVLQWRGMPWRLALRAVPALLVFATVAWLALGGYLRERFADISFSPAAVETALIEGYSDNSFQWRIINWGVLIALGMDHPLFGHGAGMTTVLNPMFNRDTGTAFNAHNDFVRFFFEAGVVGVVAYAAYAAGLCWLAVRCARRARPEVAPVAYGLAGSLLALVFLTLGSPELSLNTAILFELYGAFALVIAAERTQDRAAPIPAPATPHV